MNFSYTNHALQCLAPSRIIVKEKENKGNILFQEVDCELKEIKEAIEHFYRVEVVAIDWSERETLTVKFSTKEVVNFLQKNVVINISPPSSLLCVF